MHFLRDLLFLLLLLTPFSAKAQGSDVVWSGRVYASTVPNPVPPPLELVSFAAKLQHIFGYNQLQLLGQHSQEMSRGAEQWLLPANQVSLLVNAALPRRMPGSYQLDLQLFQGSRPVVRSTVMLSRQSPIFLKGPFYAEGQLIIILSLK
jgi:hypothetical protein